MVFVNKMTSLTPLSGAVMPQGVGTHHPEPLPVVQLMPQGGGALTVSI